MNNQEKFENLFKQSRSKLYSIAYGVSHNKEIAEDILQDAYIKAWRNFSEYDYNKKFENWMTTIIKNVAIDNNRHKSKKINTVSIHNKQTSTSITYVDFEDKSSDLYENDNKKVLMLNLYSEINNLPSDLRDVMQPFSQGYSYMEIAEKTQIPVSNVRARIHRAKQILRKNMKLATF